MSQQYSDTLPRTALGWAKYLGITESQIPAASAGWSAFLMGAANTGNQQIMVGAALCYLERTGRITAVDNFMAQINSISPDAQLPSLQNTLVTWSNNLTTSASTQFQAQSPQMPQSPPTPQVHSAPQPSLSSQYQRQSHRNAPKSPNNSVADAVTGFKSFFSGNPVQTLDTATGSLSHMWVLQGGAFILLSALALSIFPMQLAFSFVVSIIRGTGPEFSMSAREISEMNSVFREMFSALFPFGRMFGANLIGSIISFFVMVGLLKCIYVINKVNAPVVSVMNLLSASLLVLTCAYVAATFLSFITPIAYFSIVVVCVGYVGHFIMLYIGIQKVGTSSSGAFWLFLAALAIHIVIVGLVSGQIFTSMLDFDLDSLLNFIG